jgi:ATP-dependent exoDNAse (exonuclease V) alpha subunit
MVSSELLSYLSDLFARLHNVHRPFGKVNIILVGDLFQLPPVAGSFIFNSPVWSLFIPLLLSTSHRQDDDAGFFNMLKELRMGTPSVETIQQLTNKRSEYLAEDNTMTTTHIVGFRRHADRLNNIITSSLPSCNFLESIAVDYIDGHQLLPGDINNAFKRQINLPEHPEIDVGARVMFLNNSIINIGICNGSIGIILATNDDDSIKVAFPTDNGI